MSETKFTKGPWEAKLRETSSGFVWRIGPFDACLYFDTKGGVCNPGMTHEEATDIAQFIAAAPDLYAALDRIMDYAHTGARVKDIIPEDQPQFIAAYAALAKARGETP